MTLDSEDQRTKLIKLVSVAASIAPEGTAMSDAELLALSQDILDAAIVPLWEPNRSNRLTGV